MSNFVINVNCPAAGVEPAVMTMANKDGPFEVAPSSGPGH